MRVLKIGLSVCFFIFTLFVFVVGASAENTEDALIYDELTIISDNVILTGQTQQMRVEEYSGTENYFIAWASSDPSVISCTPNGEITGVKEGKATITVKAVFGDGYDTITVYCAQKLENPTAARPQNPFYFTFSKPHLFGVSGIVFNINPFQMFFPNFKGFYTSPKYNIKGTYGSYFYVEYEKNDKQYECFIPQISFSDNIASEEIFKQISKKDMDVYVGVKSDGYVLTTNYKGKVKWTVSDDTIIYFDDKTGKVEGKKPGIATISATANGKTLTCTVHSIYRWPQEWTGKVLKEDTCVYKAVGNGYEKTSYTLSVGQKFIVKGDMGGDSSWAYGVSENNIWGYIPISHISTKNTVSYYNNLNWGYPVQNKKYNYINSPYAPRPAYNDLHRGFDINEKDGQADIQGQALVAPFDGVVKRVGADLNKTNGCGYYICITSNTVDPVTGKKLIAIYQHMESWALFSQNESVKKGDIIGYAGSTGRSEGSHLHFEVNNWNAGIGDSGRSDFTYTINPIYFYMDMVNSNELVLNMDCSSVNSGYSFYFYNYDADDKRR